MKEQRVLEVINRVALGNENLGIVMRSVYHCGKDIIDTWPEENTGILVRRTLQATGLLIHERIAVREMATLKDKYWESENGKKVDVALAKFVETRKKQNNC